MANPIQVALLTHAGGAHVGAYLSALAATEECSSVLLADPDARWEADCLALKPDLLSILIGVNDIWHKLNGKYDGTVEDYEKGFTALLERHHRSGWTVADYAKELGITPAHLNAICREKSGSNALSPTAAT